MPNAIDSRSLFGKPTSVQAPTDPLSKKFAEAGKLALSDRPTLARNLGKLAARIDMAFPLKAARLMFKETDRETHWPKRKRLMRLPDEPSAAATGKGDYEAFSGQYLALSLDDMLYSIELPDFFQPSTPDNQPSRRVFGLIEGHPDFNIPFPNTVDLDEGHATG
ncbi:MAG TPA: hypothetical protein VNR60_12570 [Croceibacterium sp.]|nr:hypothetical protein [Croceibacterium sp.]